MSSIVQAAVYSKKTRIGAIRFSQSDLLEILRKVGEVVDSANASYKSYYGPSRTLSVGTEEVSIEIGGELTLERLRVAPQVAHRIFYWYRNEGAPISKVWFMFDDFSRAVEIEGGSPEQVDALFALLEKELGAYITWFSGPLFRFILMVAFFLLGWIMLSLPARRTVTRLSANLAGLLFMILAPVLMFFGVDWFPGVAVYAGEPSFLARNNPLISFLGLLLAPILFILQIGWEWFRQPTRKTRR